MDECSIVGEPEIEDGAVVVRVVVRDPAIENTGPVFVCRFTDFDSIAVEEFPEGQTPSSPGSYRALATEAARAYAGENLGRFEELFEELARRKA